MIEVPGIVVMGASGRMGRMLVQEIAASDRMRLVGALERTGHDWIGRDLGECMGGQASGITVSDDPLPVFAGVRAVLDFTTPEATVANSVIAAQARLVHVIGTTGLDEDHLAKIAAADPTARILICGSLYLAGSVLRENG